MSSLWKYAYNYGVAPNLGKTTTKKWINSDRFNDTGHDGFVIRQLYLQKSSYDLQFT